MKRLSSILLLFLPGLLLAQPSWKRTTLATPAEVELFHISQTANLPTTETLRKGGFMYEISHRFGPVSSGYSSLYGLDGPVNMRTALSYGLSNHLMFTIGRSTVQDNLDLRLKYKFLQFSNKSVPSVIAVQAGMAFNTEAYAGLDKRSAFDGNSTQFYGQLIYNAMLWDKKFGFGAVPSLVYNSFIYANNYRANTKYSLSLPVYAQWYINRMWSFFGEFTPVVKGWEGNIFYTADENSRSYKSLGFGVAIETGGHVFYLFTTNSGRLNPTQFLLGADSSFEEKDSWRLAFSITREL
ncbi:MAG: hypothetical protein DWQ05_18910 [Calditrichaeota bacterium]|nr:MAG: hypothetical protein DWQ05_18910 [Calditrichota bacterium]